MQALKDFYTTHLADQSWIVQVFVIVFLTLLANYIAKRLFDKLGKRLEQTSSPWDDALLGAARRPAGIFIWVVGIGWAADVVRQLSDAVIFQAIDPLHDLLVIALLAWFLVRFVSAAESNLLAREQPVSEMEVDEPTVKTVAKLLRLTVIITAVLVALQTLGYSISGVLAFGGIGGVAVGFAAKDLLANFFGGLMIYLDKPFMIGDWIRSPDQEVEGTVEDIGWRQTRIRTFDKRPLYVPNATFTQISVENPSRMKNRRIKETIGVRYADAAALASITAEVEKMLQKHEDIDAEQTLMVYFDKFAASSLDFFIYCFTKTTDWETFHGVKQDVLFKILEIIADHDAEVAFPTRTIEMQQADLQAGQDSGNGSGQAAGRA
ncbi:MAG: mechanosensitive ion channel family protein [Gammaproteobacteria bacterium]|nr:mechanosensitive ion channel family protein [Gammaproteobacteria bacterium]NND40152.1 mechanosensitive ion channel family protein [Pseudomonadales bacterium]MBT8150726.1 mechanosensitive ion channel family protein [Gammaproteobacteria bacterium]NNL11304.1 mechanosensitive ion channel family protein [Pseudomonadales bacterium]NNM12174.1 mechanosensitive ion channel family protein [Pseudomonadales bacterium]